MSSDPIPRSPELLSRHDSALLIVDVQGKLFTLIPNHLRLVWNARRLIEAAGIMSVPILATEQNPEKLGATTEELARLLPDPLRKMTFSCCGLPEFTSLMLDRGLLKLVVAGIETHVCILQTVLDLLGHGFRVHVPADAVGSRSPMDHDVALRRMESAGATVTTTEMVVFEWCERAGTDEFRQISQIVRRSPPSEAN